MRVWLERLGAGFVLVQAGVFVALLVWPPGTDLAAVVARLQLWQGLAIYAWQGLLGLPVLAALVWRARGGARRGLMLGALLASAGVLALSFDELLRLGTLLEPQAMQAPVLRLMGAHRLAEAALALAALGLMRLAVRHERLSVPAGGSD
jgi:hypothetical protein